MYEICHKFVYHFMELYYICWCMCGEYFVDFLEVHTVSIVNYSANFPFVNFDNVVTSNVLLVASNFLPVRPFNVSYNSRSYSDLRIAIITL